MEASIVIPAHNEEKRLAATLVKYKSALSQRFGYGDGLEFLVVANGCTDRTAAVAVDFAKTCPQVKVMDVAAPSGKGGAVLAGFREARGQRIAFADADGATDPGSLLRLLDELDFADVVIGSRHMRGSVITRRQPLRRRIFGRLFHACVQAFFGLPYRDTQCGAKAFRRHAAKELAGLVEERNWTFDVDLLLWARFLGLRVREVPVVWADQPGSTLRVTATLNEVLSSLWRLKRREMGTLLQQAERRGEVFR